ncbi:hypothetical protein [Blastococcus brunescens]|uniref:Uncharacterized protein n=1 Tax=Blastococcus brunescens TaxID=1564165 RepID=A0ABZ1AX97_9ACTN|nr:hypothetical protein [Blastococcus sp. BMG 8361]WRL62018.1 hypothetical protein U6N30_18270 [Blastococcus sp. BMG 8361]
MVQEKPDDGNCSPQAGSTGFDITVTRIFRDLASGAEIKREDFQTRYAAEPVIRCVPPAAPPRSRRRAADPSPARAILPCGGPGDRPSRYRTCTLGR